MARTNLGENSQGPEDIVFSLQKTQDLCIDFDQENLIQGNRWADPADGPPPEYIVPFLTPIDLTLLENYQIGTGETGGTGGGADCVFYVCVQGTDQYGEELNKCESREKTIRWYIYYVDIAQRILYAYQTYEDCCKACGCCGSYDSKNPEWTRDCDCPIPGQRKITYLEGDAFKCCGQNMMVVNTQSYDPSDECVCTPSSYTKHTVTTSLGEASLCCPPTYTASVGGKYNDQPDCVCPEGESEFDAGSEKMCCGKAKNGGGGEDVQLTPKQNNSGSYECSCPQGSELYTINGQDICCEYGYEGHMPEGSSTPACISEWYCDGSGSCKRKLQSEPDSAINDANTFKSQTECETEGCGKYICNEYSSEGPCKKVTSEMFKHGPNSFAYPIMNYPAENLFSDETSCESVCFKHYCSDHDCKYVNFSALKSTPFQQLGTLYDDYTECAPYCEQLWSCSGSDPFKRCVSSQYQEGSTGFTSPEDCCAECDNCGSDGRCPYSDSPSSGQKNYVYDETKQRCVPAPDQ